MRRKPSLQLPAQQGNRTIKISRRPLLIAALIAGSISLLAFVLTVPLWLPGLLRDIIPDRYISAYFPESLQRSIFDYEPYLVVPTANPVGEVAISDLLAELNENLPPATSTPAPADTEAEPGTSGDVPGSTGGQIFVPVGGENTTPVSESILLDGFTHEYQGWNNCGPATVAMMMTYWGIDTNQWHAAEILKPNKEDRNVSPDELAGYAERMGYSALVRVNGNLDILRRLLSAGYPVMVEKGFNPEPDRIGWMGHYVLLAGYDDTEQKFITMDSYSGPGRRHAYQDFDEYWRHFNRVYVVVFPETDRDKVEQIIGPDVDDYTMYLNAVQNAQAGIEQMPEDPFYWFNLGSSLVGIGDFVNASKAYDIARNTGLPWRMLWYQFGPYETYLSSNVARYADVITLADTVIAGNEYSEEAYFYKGRALQAQGNYAEASRLYNQALSYNALFTAAQQALNTLP